MSNSQSWKHSGARVISFLDPMLVLMFPILNILKYTMLYGGICGYMKSVRVYEVHEGI